MMMPLTRWRTHIIRHEFELKGSCTLRGISIISTSSHGFVKLMFRYARRLGLDWLSTKGHVDDLWRRNREECSCGRIVEAESRGTAYKQPLLCRNASPRASATHSNREVFLWQEGSAYFVFSSLLFSRLSSGEETIWWGSV